MQTSNGPRRLVILPKGQTITKPQQEEKLEREKTLASQTDQNELASSSSAMELGSHQFSGSSYQKNQVEVPNEKSSVSSPPSTDAQTKKSGKSQNKYRGNIAPANMNNWSGNIAPLKTTPIRPKPAESDRPSSSPSYFSNTNPPSKRRRLPSASDDSALSHHHIDSLIENAKSLSEALISPRVHETNNDQATNFGRFIADEIRPLEESDRLRIVKYITNYILDQKEDIQFSKNNS